MWALPLGPLNHENDQEYWPSDYISVAFEMFAQVPQYFFLIVYSAERTSLEMPFFGVCSKRTLHSRYPQRHANERGASEGAVISKESTLHERIFIWCPSSSTQSRVRHAPVHPLWRCFSSPSARTHSSLTHTHTFAGCFFFCEFLCRLSAEYIRADKWVSPPEIFPRR